MANFLNSSKLDSSSTSKLSINRIMKPALFLPVTLLNFIFFNLLNAQDETNDSLQGEPIQSSNLGIQEIVEVGVPLQLGDSDDQNASESKIQITETVSGTPLGSLKNAPPLVLPSSSNNLADQFAPAEESSPPTEESSRFADLGLGFSAHVGLRAYQTNNVLRQKSSMAESSSVFETSAGLGMKGPEKELGEYVTMIPGIDLFVQWANYEKNSDLLDYRFGMAKGGLQFGLPKDWTVNVSLDYNVLHSWDSGDKFFDSVSPGVTLQKLFPLTEESFFIIESMIRWSNMDAVQVFEAAGIFPDSGNNYQTSLSASYIHQFGQDMKWTFMPRIAINRTNYTVTPNTGRLDYLFTGGLSLIYQWNEWLGMQVFWTYASMSSDTIDDFDVNDLGVALSGSYRF